VMTSQEDLTNGYQQSVAISTARSLMDMSFDSYWPSVIVTVSTSFISKLDVNILNSNLCL